MDNPVVIATMVALLIALVMYALFVPKSNRRFIPDNEEQAASNPILKLVGALGDDLYSALPAGAFENNKKRSSNPRIESLLTRSGNPWGLKADEFITFQWICGFLAFILGWILWFALSQIGMELPWFLAVPAVTIFGFFIPRINYMEHAKTRDLEFKRQLPEALDLLIISLSGGVSFTQAIREVIPNMRDGILKDEFISIVKSLDAGETQRNALESFANRAPNEGIKSFVRAIQASIEQNTPLIENLQARADASRQEFFSLLHQKTAQLSSKLSMNMTSTLLPAVVIIAVAPSAVSMMQSMG